MGYFGLGSLHGHFFPIGEMKGCFMSNTLTLIKKVMINFELCIGNNLETSWNRRDKGFYILWNMPFPCLCFLWH